LRFDHKFLMTSSKCLKAMTEQGRNLFAAYFTGGSRTFDVGDRGLSRNTDFTIEAALKMPLL